MNPIDEVNIIRNILVCNTFSVLDSVRADAESSFKKASDESLELGLIATAATLQMCSPLRMRDEAASWDILIDSLDHAVVWIEYTAQSQPEGDTMAGQLLEL